MTLAIKAQFSQNINPHRFHRAGRTVDGQRMRMRENDVTLRIPKTSYGRPTESS